MWIENKSAGTGLAGSVRVGRVTFSKSGRTLRYRDLELQSLNGMGFKANYFDTESGEKYWVSGCRKDGRDALYNTDVEVDADVQEEYWRDIREMPDRVGTLTFRAKGKY